MRLRNWWTGAAVVVLVAVSAATPQEKTTEHYYFFQLVFLSRPANAPQMSPDALEKLQEEHMGNIHLMHRQGKLMLAGPMLDDTPLKGIFVFKTQSAVEAEKWARTDPAIKANRLAPEIHTWIQPENSFSNPPESNPMENYALVLYRPGPNAKPHNGWDPIMKDHAAWLQDLRDSGKMVIGGPFRDGGPGYTHLLIFTGSAEDAAATVARDPFVVAGEAVPEVHPWMTQKGVLRQ